MSDFKIIGNFPVDQEIDATSTTQEAPLGLRVQARDTASTDYGVGEFIYLVGVASTVATDCVTYDAGGFTTARSVANAVGPVAFAMSANVAGQYGWYQIAGRGVGTGNASDAADKLMYLHATAGSVSDGVVAGDSILGAVSTSALNTPATGKIEITLTYPFVSNESN